MLTEIKSNTGFPLSLDVSVPDVTSSNWQDSAVPVVEEVPVPDWQQSAISVDGNGTPESPEDKAKAEQDDLLMSMRTGMSYESLQKMRGAETNIVNPKRKWYQTAEHMASRFSDQLHNVTIASFVQTMSGRDSSAAEDRAFELVKQWEKENNIRLPDDQFSEYLHDWTKQLYNSPDYRDDYIKGEPIYKVPKDIETIFSPRPMDAPEGWTDNSIDIVAGLIGFAAEVALLKKQFPLAPNSVLFDTVAISNGGHPLSGASMAGAMEILGGIIPKSAPVPVQKLVGGVGTGALFGATTAISGGDTKEIVINTGLPIILGYMSINRADWNSLKPKSKLDLIRAAKDVVPELANTPTPIIDIAISESLSENRPANLPYQSESKPTGIRTKEQLVGEINKGINEINPRQDGQSPVDGGKTSGEIVSLSEYKKANPQPLAIVDHQALVKNALDNNKIPYQGWEKDYPDLAMAWEQHKGIQEFRKNLVAQENKPPATSAEKQVDVKPFGNSEELAISQTSQNIIEQAVLKQLLPEGEVDPKMHNVMKLKEAARIATETVLNDPTQTELILANQADAPSGTTPLAILKAAKEKAYIDYKDNPNAAIDKVLSLKDADVIDQATSAGQLLVSLREQRKYDPVATAADIVEARGIIPDSTLAKNLSKAQKRFDKADAELASKGIESVIKETKIPTPTSKVDTTAKTYGTKNKIVNKDSYEAAKQRLRETKFYSGVDPKQVLDMLEIATYHLEAIGRNLPEWTRVLKEEFGDKIKPYLGDLWKRANLRLSETEKKNLIDKITLSAEKGKSLVDMAKPIRQLMKNLVDSGIEKREPLLDEMHKILKQIDPAITRRDVMDAMSGYGRFKQLSKEELDAKVRDLVGQYQQVAKLQDMQKGQAPSKTGIERRTPSDEERRLIQQVEEAKKKGGYDVVDPEKQLKSSLEEIKTRLKNRISDLKEQIESGQKTVKTKTEQPSDQETIRLTTEKDKLQKEFDEMFGNKLLTTEQRVKMAKKSLESSIAEYERRIKEKDLTTQKDKPISTPELESLRSRRDALKDELQTLKDAANPKKTPEEIRLQSYKTKLASEKAKYNEKIASEDFVKPEKKSIPIDKKTQALIDERNAAKIVLKTAQEIFEKKGGIARTEVGKLIELSNKIEETKKVLDGEPLDKNGMPVDKKSFTEKVTAYGDAILYFSEYEQKLVPKEHTWYNLAIDIAGLPQALMTSIDFSFPFRQGWGSMATKEFWQGFGKQYSYAWSEANYRKLNAEMIGSPRYKLAKKARLGLTNLGSDISQLGAREEGMQSTLADTMFNFIEKTPMIGKQLKYVNPSRYVRASQRAYTGMADYIRWNRFNNMVDAYTLMKPETNWSSKEGIKVAKQLAKVINMMTGRGNIWKEDELGNASVAANQVMFSIRKWSGDLNMLDPTNYIGFGKYTKLDPFVRKMAVRQLAGSLSMTIAILGLAKMSGAEIETDPDSANFAMIHIGNRYYDISGGKISLLVWLHRISPEFMGGGKIKSSDTGYVASLTDYEYGSPTRLSVTGRYLRGKLAPNVSLFFDYLAGEDMQYNPVTNWKEFGADAAKKFYPMLAGDTAAMLNDDVYGDVFANLLLNLGSMAAVSHGVGVQVHTPEGEE